MKNNKIKNIVLSLGLSLTAFSAAIGGVVIKESRDAVVACADSSTYYSGISDTATGNTLLSSLRTLNGNKKTKNVGYSSMGTTSSGSFKYTDYDPDSVKKDNNGQPYGTKILSFYSGTKCTSFNREHTWPNSHGGGSVDGDIHMTRPTVPSENGSRGNSFFVEGLKSSSLGWDPAMETWGDATYRGDAARIIFYCVVANSNLGLLDVEYHNTSNNNPDYKMGKLSTLLEWNLRYPVTQREQNRNAGAEYLQGNRNPFIDHPEYACKIWGDTNTTTKAICAKAVGPKTVSVSPKTATVGVGGKVTLTATTDNGSTALLWKTSNASVATVDDNGVVSGVSQGTATITAYSSYDSNVKATATVTVKGVKSISISGTPTKTQYYEGDSFNPNGLKVTATYSDSTSEIVQNSACKWYDGTNNSSLKLVKGSTSVKCVLGSASATYTGITVLERQVSNEYTLLTSDSDLVEGNKVIFAYNPTNAVAGTFAGGKYLSSKTATFSSDKNTITDIGGATEFTLSKDGEAWKFTSNEGVLGAGALKTLAYDGGTMTWNITPNSDGTTTVSSTNSAFGSILYNTSSESLRFMNYGTQGTDTPIRPIQLYVKGQKGSGDDPIIYDGEITGITISKNEIALNVGETTSLTANVSGTGRYDAGVTWVSTDESVATVDNNGVVTAVGVGYTGIRAISSDPNIYASCVCYVSNKQTSGSGEYTLVTSDSQLVSGSKVIFAYNQSNAVAGSHAGSKYLASEDATFSSDKKTITNIKNAQEFTLGKSGDSWTFTGSEGVLGASSVKKLVFDSGVSTWDISVTSAGVATVSSTTADYGSILYNTSSDALRFMNYSTSSQGPESPIRDIQLYVKEEGGGEIISASLSIDGEDELSLLSGATGTLTYSYTGDTSKITEIAWSSSDEDVLIINSDGSYEAGEAGTSNVFLYVYTSDGAGFYHDSISVTVSEDKNAALDAVRAFVDAYMHLSDYNENLGWCKDTEHHYYSDAKEAFNNLTDYQRELFLTESEFDDAHARLVAWAKANGDVIENNTHLIIKGRYKPSYTSKTPKVTLIAIVCSSVISLLGVYLLIIKKKENYEK